MTNKYFQNIDSFYKVMKQYFMVLFLISVSTTSFAQAPANDDPCNAITLTPDLVCTFQTFTNANATASAGVPAPGCASYSGSDVWFQVTLPTGVTSLIIDTKQGVITDGGMAIYRGSCSGLTLISCDDDGSANGLMPLLSPTGLTPNSTIWIRVWEFGNDNNGTFEICVRIPPPPPVNDEPCNATPLTVGTDCNFATFTNESATATAGAPAPGCAGYTGGDVWFSVIVPAGGAINFNTQAAVMTDGGMAIYRGPNCSNLTLISCDDNTGAGNMPKIIAGGLTPGDTIWVRVWENGNNNNGTFGICAQIPPPPPVNDEPCNAIIITPDTVCVYQTFTNENATASAGIPAPGCASYSGADVWFQVTVPPGRSLIFDSQTGVMLDGGMAIYKGPDCNNLTLISCNDDSSPNGAMPLITNDTLTPGSTIWIRMWEFGNDNNGTFGLCVKIPPPPPVNDSICGAIELFPSATCTYQTYTNAMATATSGANPPPAPGCAGYSGGDVWFKVVVPAGGALTIDTKEGVVTDGGMAIYRGGLCTGVLTLIACDDNSSANGNMPKLLATGLTPGSTLWIRVWENGNNNNGTFGICVTIPPPPPANDDPCGVIILTANPTCQYTTYTTESAGGTTGPPVPGCANFQGGDVWFRVQVPAGGALNFDMLPGTMLNGGMAIYRGGVNCTGNLTLLACDDNSSGNPLMPFINQTGLTPGSNIWIRVWGVNGIENAGTFGICVSIPLPEPTTFSFNCKKDTTVSCNTNCFSLTTKIPNIHTSSCSYEVNPISGPGGCFSPYVSPGTPGPSTSLTIDDRYSSVIALPFSFPFYCENYSKLVVSTNGYLSFDTTRAGLFSHWDIVNGTTPQDLPSATFYDKALIMGPYHDIDPGVNTSPTLKIKYNVTGVAPHRKWILSFNKAPLFQAACNNLINNTHQIVLYEGTGIVEVFIYEMQNCLTWNEGRAMVGMQDMTRTQAIMAPGRKASDAPWGALNMNESWRFVPSAGPTLFKKVELFDLNGNLIAVGDTSSINASTLAVNFNNICSSQAAGGTTTYVVKSTYTQFGNPNAEEYGTDTINVTRAAIPRLGNDTAVSACSNSFVDLTALHNTTGLTTSWAIGGAPVATPAAVTAPGVYQLIATNTSGCSDTALVTVTINQSPALGNDTALNLCYVNTTDLTVLYSTTGYISNWTFGGDFVQNPQAVSQSGTYQLIAFNDAGGCADTALAIVNFNGKPDLGADQSVAICPGYSTDLTTVFITTNLTSNWTLQPGGTPVSNPGVVTAPGTYQLIVSNQYGCMDTAIVTVSFNPQPALGNDVTANTCSPLTVNLTTLFATGGLTAVWTLAGAPVANPEAVSQSGTYQIVVSNSNGCKDTALAVVTISPKPSLGADQSTVICTSATTNLTTFFTTTGLTPVWTVLPGGTVVANPSAVGTAGTYQLIASSSAGCLDTALVTVSVNNLTATNTTTNGSCSGGNGTITVTASGGLIPYSYAIGTGSFGSSNVFSQPGASTYTLTVKDGNLCTATTIAVVGFTNDLTVQSRPDTAICDNVPVLLTTVSNGAGFSWTPTTALDNPAIASPVATPATATQYIVTATLGTCTAKDTVNINMSPTPTVNAGNDVTVVQGSNAQLNASVVNGVSYEWSPITYLSATNVLNPVVVNPVETITYRLSASNSLGCSSFDEVTVIVIPSCINVRSAFTPNGDGVNDTWKVYDNFACLSNATVQVYNRYGSKVYESTNYRNQWNGTYNGKALPDATYYYVVKFDLAAGGFMQKRGDVTILR